MTGRYSVSNNAVTGWYFNAEDEQDRFVDLYCNDTRLRRLRAGRGWPKSSDPQHRDRSCGFALNLTPQLKKLMPRGSRLTVAGSNGQALPQNGAHPEIGEALDGGDALRRRLEQGWIIDKWGGVKLPFQAAPGLDQRLFDFYSETSEKIEAEAGVELYLAYGSLLGCVRDNSLIPFDDDVDCAYLSRFRTIDEVAREFHQLKATLRGMAPKHGFALDVVNTGQISIVLRDFHFDVFTSWIGEDQSYNCYFGVSGPIADNRLELKQISFLDNQARIPVLAERVLELTYGPGWKVPDPAFDWSPGSQVQKTMDQLRERGRALTGQDA